MTTRQIAIAVIVLVLATIAVIAAVEPVLPEKTVHVLHLTGLILGGLDVAVVVVSLLCAESH